VRNDIGCPFEVGAAEAVTPDAALGKRDWKNRMATEVRVSAAG
jgi:hypothetical protein